MACLFLDFVLIDHAVCGGDRSNLRFPEYASVIMRLQNKLTVHYGIVNEKCTDLLNTC